MKLTPILLLLCGLTAQPVFACEELPASILSYMANLDSPLAHISRDQFLPRVKEFIEYPGCVSGNFRGGKEKDYALLVKTDNNIVSLAVFFDDEKKTSHRILENFLTTIEEGVTKRYVFVNFSKPGVYVGAEENPLYLKNPGFIVTLGHVSVIYYWKSGSFYKYWVSD